MKGVLDGGVDHTIEEKEKGKGRGREEEEKDAMENKREEG